MTRPLCIDLYCGAGFAADGYNAAGFDVVGIDIAPQPNYPYPMIVGDALVWLALQTGLRPTLDGRPIALVHASPPCQAYSDLRHRTGRDYPELIEPTRELLQVLGLPYVIENVEGAPLVEPIMLCGTMFPGLRVLRHRLFESSLPLVQPTHRLPHPLCRTRDKRKRHYGHGSEWSMFVSVNGGGNCSVAAARDAMQVERGTKAELNEGIPPRYTYAVALQLLGLGLFEQV